MYYLYKKIKNFIGLKLSFLNDIRWVKRLRGRPFVNISLEVAQKTIIKELTKENPRLVARIGGNELDAFVTIKKQSKVKSLELINEMQVTAGVLNFEEIQEQFYYEYFRAISKIDLLAVWRKEEKYLKILNESIVRINLNDLEVFRSKNPFTASLKAKKILIINPFVATINEQLNSSNQEVQEYLLRVWGPNLKKLIFYKPVVSHGKESYKRDKTWIELLEDQKRELKKLDFDVAIISAGAYGLPLGAYIKEELKKNAIVVGGVLQLYFGIIGSRWMKNAKVLKNIPKGARKRVLKSDKPQGSELVENNAYF